MIPASCLGDRPDAFDVVWIGPGAHEAPDYRGIAVGVEDRAK